MREMNTPGAADAAVLGPRTTPCPVRISLCDGAVLDAVVYLLSDSIRPGGVTSVEAILAAEREFVPIGIDGKSALVARSAIRKVEMFAECPGVGDLVDRFSTFDVVNLRLDSGEVLSGVLHTLAPADGMRMSDLFNATDRFLTLSTGDRLILVSKAHVVLVSFF